MRRPRGVVIGDSQAGPAFQQAALALAGAGSRGSELLNVTLGLTPEGSRVIERAFIRAKGRRFEVKHRGSR